jgi:hypothetical protein
MHQKKSETLFITEQSRGRRVSKPPLPLFDPSIHQLEKQQQIRRQKAIPTKPTKPTSSSNPNPTTHVTKPTSTEPPTLLSILP